jgi:Fe-S-cluster containining protein
MLFFVSMAGYSFELLCRRYPEMFNKVLEARRKALGNNGLREIFEEFCPGLFEKLNKFSRDINSYAAGLKATEEYLKQ